MKPQMASERLGPVVETVWVYRYEALDLNQVEAPIRQQGLVFAATLALARQQLQAKRWRVLKLRRLWRPLAWQVNPNDLRFFTQQLAALLRAGLPLLHVLGLLAEGHPKRVMGQLLANVRYDVAQGRPLSQALLAYRATFGDVYLAVLAAGEVSGTLDAALQALAQSLSKRQHLSRQLRLAFMYPAMVLLLAALLVLGLVWFVLPSFAALYASVGAPLPAATVWLLSVSAWVERYFWLGWLGGAVLALGWRWRGRQNVRWRQSLSRLTLQVPISGQLQRRLILVRWVHTLAMLHAAGVPLLQSLASVAQVSGHFLYEQATLTVRHQVAEGQSLSAALRETALFPELLLQLVLVGEEAGALDELLYRAAAHYGDEVDQTVALLSVWLEPLLLLVLGLVVGAVLLALYLPLFNIGDAIV